MNLSLNEWVPVPPPACVLEMLLIGGWGWGITEHTWLYLPHLVTITDVPEKGCEITARLNPDCLGL